MLQYEKLGKNACKKFKVSPDATAQLVKQLAFHRLYNRPGVCYESCQTRKFALGRTEVIRPASSESKAWAEAMSDASKTNAERIALFKKAVNRHLQYAAWAADGQGIDRHLFGLKRQLKEGEVSNFFLGLISLRKDGWLIWWLLRKRRDCTRISPIREPVTGR